MARESKSTKWPYNLMRLLLLITSILLLLATSAFAEPTMIKLSQLATPGSTKVLAIGYFKKLLEERSHGRLLVEIIDSKQSDTPDSLEQLERHKIQLAVPDLTNLSFRFQDLQLLELPFLFRNLQQLQSFIESSSGKQLFSSLEQQNYKALAFWDSSFRHLIASCPLPTATDARGLNFIGAENRLASVLFKKINAGQPPITNHTGYNCRTLDEVQITDLDKNTVQYGMPPQIVTLSNHSVTGHLILAHREFWEGLPEDLKVITQNAMKDAGDYARELAEQADQLAVQQIEKGGTLGIYRLSPAQREQWRKTLLSDCPLVMNDRLKQWFEMLTATKTEQAD
ncbi:MAG: TRAP transporter substrate-binding protein DctP [Chloroflexi bacterium]|nr:TRAP transporter substrate-binding protein DctP [Chloroflexota bacterium]